MVSSQTKVQQHLLRQLSDFGCSEIINILDIGLTESLRNNEWEPDTNNISENWRDGIYAQNKIGWRQIYHGRIAQPLIEAIDQHYRSNTDTDPFKYNGERWARQLIQTIWDAMLELWQTRNTIMNNNDTQQKEKQKKEKMETRVRRCYSFQGLLRHAERLRWFTETADDMLKKDAWFIETWTKAVKRLISITNENRKKGRKKASSWNGSSI
jgi:hypothetical protein